MIQSIEKIEAKVTLLLQIHAKDDYSKWEIAPHLAKKSLMMGHLYFDLGLRNRFEMGRYMKEHFPSLAQKKPQNKLWKKFIYDSIDEVAPSCATCKDSINCFACNDSRIINFNSIYA
ncbi:MAG TPA: hydrogenase [Campylobacterales bacterium]|nr:hydrogenase [Campylobacterales bacterium]HHD80863.1 hydrogenase [Campylobacterales bacterium]HHH51091.1 hydrogenase [Campylobacterales bacterium]